MLVQNEFAAMPTMGLAEFIQKSIDTSWRSWKYWNQETQGKLFWENIGWIGGF